MRRTTEIKRLLLDIEIVPEHREVYEKLSELLTYCQQRNYTCVASIIVSDKVAQLGTVGDQHEKALSCLHHYLEGLS